MKTKILLTVFILILNVAQINAQAHDNRGNACTLLSNKGPGSAVEPGAFCPACAKKDKMEREARTAESERRAKVQAEKNKANQIARQKALEKERKENDAKLKASEVFVTMPKTPIGKRDESEINEIGNYKIVNEFNSLEKMSYLSTYNSKILYKNKVAFQSNEFLYINMFFDKLLFTVTYPRKDESCKSTLSTNSSILLDKNFKKINLEGIDKFYYASTNRDNREYIDITVLTGKCTPVEDDNFVDTHWHTIIYTFDYKTKKLVKSEPSSQNSSCACD
jgi:hypothetical protein